MNSITTCKNWQNENLCKYNSIYTGAYLFFKFGTTSILVKCYIIFDKFNFEW